MRSLEVRLVFLLLGTVWTGLDAQQAIPTTGGNAAGTGGSVSYSIGQVLFATTGGPGGTMAQGVQQPYEISVVSGMEEHGILLQCSVLPNPASDHVVLQIEGEWKPVKACLYDSGGRLLEAIRINSGETELDMKGRAPGAYFLRVVRDSRQLKVFKIIRN